MKQRFNDIFDLLLFLQIFHRKLLISKIESKKISEYAAKTGAEIESIGSLTLFDVLSMPKSFLDERIALISPIIDQLFIDLVGKTPERIVGKYRERIQKHTDFEFGYRIYLNPMPFWWGLALFLKEDWVHNGQPTEVEKLAFAALDIIIMIDKTPSYEKLE